MADVAQGYAELIPCFHGHGTRLGELKMVCLTRSTAMQTRLTPDMG